MKSNTAFSFALLFLSTLFLSNNLIAQEAGFSENKTPLIIPPPDVEISCKADINDLRITGQPEIIKKGQQLTLTFKDKELTSDPCGSGMIERGFILKDLEGKTLATAEQRFNQ